MYLSAALSVLAAVLALCGCSTTPSNVVGVAGTCPYGHQTLQRVPVVHGLMAITPQMQRKIDRHQLIYGGCVDWGNRSAIVCRTCGYVLEADPVTEWERESNDASSFQPHISHALVAFAQLGSTAPQYHQKLRQGALYEEFSALLDENDDRSRHFIDQWIGANGLKLKVLERGSRTTTWLGEGWTISRASVGPGQTVVSVEHRIENPGLVANAPPAIDRSP